jgi:hypothetical protein
MTKTPIFYIFKINKSTAAIKTWFEDFLSHAYLFLAPNIKPWKCPLRSGTQSGGSGLFDN